MRCSWVCDKRERKKGRKRKGKKMNRDHKFGNADHTESRSSGLVDRSMDIGSRDRTFCVFMQVIYVLSLYSERKVLV